MTDIRYASVHRLQRALGTSTDVENPFSFVRIEECDRNEAFPAEACRILDEFGMAGYYVPAGSGGSLENFDELIQLLRAVAGRDMTVAVAHAKTFLGAASVWVAGNEQQRNQLGSRIRDGTVISWGLSERDHGSDLLASEVSAARSGEGWRLTGQKWLINNATRGQLMCVLARTDRSGGARGQSLFLLDKRVLPDGAYECLPKVPTHGIRGADISGIEFRDARLPASALVGSLGGGIEIVLKALQLTRTICVSLSLGAADHALRLAYEFVAARHLYGRKLIELPRVRALLGEAITRSLLAESVSVLSGRIVHELPSEMSFVSAVAKAFVPTQVQRMLDDLAELLGVRGFLAGMHEGGEFAKVERDHRIVEIFDGSTAVNRGSLIAQFPRLARSYAAGKADLSALRAAAFLASPVSALDPSRLALSSPNGCSVLGCVPEQAARVRQSAGNVPDELQRLVFGLETEVAALHRELAKVALGTGAVPASSFALAEKYEWCFAGAACLHLWLENEGPVSDTAWLRACLAQVLNALGGECVPEGVYDELVERDEWNLASMLGLMEPV